LPNYQSGVVVLCARGTFGSLFSNEIGHIGAKELAYALVKNTTLRKLVYVPLRLPIV
jgi:hypothetical protein